MSRLHILMDGEHLGTLDGRGRGVRVAYDPDLDPAGVPLSLSMPLARPRHRGQPVVRWLSALLPDRDAVLGRWRRDFGITDLNPESLLAHIGEDVAGAAQFVRDDRLGVVQAGAGRLESLTDDDIAGIAVAVLQDSMPSDPDTAIGRFSLAGAQAKFALQLLGDGSWALPSGSEPSTHIFKPAIPGLADQDVAETASMRVAAQVGIPTARTFVREFADQRVIGIERYDRWRDNAGRWRRLHQEDLCQAGATDPRLKYESEGGPGVAACGELIRRFSTDPVQDVRTFARAVIFNSLVKGSDAHARNYSLLITHGDVRLAPLYDVNSTLPFGEAAEARTLAMRIGGEERLSSITRGNWRLFAAALHLEEEWVLDQLRAMATILPAVADDVCRQPDLAGLADRTLERFRHGCERWTAEALRNSTGSAPRSGR